MDHKGAFSIVVIALGVLCDVVDGAPSHFGSDRMAWPWHTFRTGARGFFGPSSRSAGQFASPWVNKRSVSTTDKRFHIIITIDHCLFGTYDIDGDGVVTLTEMRMLFEDGKTAAGLFKALDHTQADGRVTKEEFQYTAPRTIDNCETSQL